MPPLSLYARARILSLLCARDRGCSAHPAFPAPSLEGRLRPLVSRVTYQDSGASCRETAKSCPSEAQREYEDLPGRKIMKFQRHLVARLRVGRADHPHAQRVMRREADVAAFVRSSTMMSMTADIAPDTARLGFVTQATERTIEGLRRRRALSRRADSR